MKLKTIRTISALVLAIAMVFAFAGCEMVSVDEEKRSQQVVAEVNGEKILRSDFDYQLEIAKYNYGYTDSTWEGLGEDTKQSVCNAVLDSMVNTELEYQDAVANGYEMTDEEKADLDQQWDDFVEELENNYRTMLESNEEYSHEEIELKVQEYVAMQVGQNYVREEKLQDLYKAQIVDDYEQDIKDGVTVTDQDVKDYYDLTIENQKNTLESSPSMMAMYSSFGQEVYVYPEDVRAVQNLLIAFPEDKQTQISSLRSAEENDQADAEREAALQEIQQKADEVLAAVQAAAPQDAESFALLMDEYGEDTGMKNEPNRTEGYKVYEGASYVQEFIDGAMALQKEGDISGLIASDYGYHILRLVSFPPAVVPFEEVEDDIRSELTSTKEQEAISNKQAELKEAANVKTYYDRLTN